MKKALAQNPNMLRTMIGLGLTLIVILSYAVYGATIDSSYYLYHTSNEHVEHEAIDQGLSRQCQPILDFLNQPIDIMVEHLNCWRQSGRCDFCRGVRWFVVSS